MSYGDVDDLRIHGGDERQVSFFLFFFFPLPSFLVFLSRNPNYNDTIITVEKKKYGEKTNIINENNDSISNKPPKEVRIHLDAIMLVIPYSYSP